MSGILKVGMTLRTPEARLKEANTSDTWRPPTPYQIEFAKKVYKSSQKEKTLHILLEQYTDRIHPRREFFRVSTEDLSKFFDMMDGEIWVETRIEEEEEEDEEEQDEQEEEEDCGEGRRRGSSKYVPKDIFQDQVILRQVLNGTEFKGKYDATTDQFITDEGVFHSSLRKWNIANSNAVEMKSIPNCRISFKIYDGEKYVRIAGCRDMTKCFTNGQRIRHTIGINKTWIGT